MLLSDTQISGSEFKAVAKRRRILSDDMRMHPYRRQFSDFGSWQELHHSTVRYDDLCHIKACGMHLFSCCHHLKIAERNL